jgi:penicillin-binding protein 1C
MKRTGFVIGLLMAGMGQVCFALPSHQEVRASYSVSDAVLLDRHGEVIHELRVDPHGRRLQWTVLQDISPALITAVVRSEDKRFYDHHGADWRALASAALGHIFSNGKRGASTITMQLAAMLDGSLRSAASRRTAAQKWDQIEAARDLEKRWTKDQVLEAYLNLVTFRGELQGIAAASRGIFRKDPGGLDASESVILAALIRSPNAAQEKVTRRATALAAVLGTTAAPEQIAGLARIRLSAPPAVKARVELAPHVAHRLLRPGTTQAQSTLDGSVQRLAADSLRQAVSALSGQNVRDGAVLIVENRTGDVLAYVGNSGRLSSAPYVDGIRAPRQAGSTLKPFLYGLALEKRLITAASLIEDEPIDLPTGRGVYRPANYDREFRGAVTARTALASSLNIPAVKTLGLVGTDAFVRKLREYGFSDLAESEHYGPSLALGTADITLWELVNAYRAIANDGVRSGLKLSRREATGPVVRTMSPETAFIISDILADREARSATFSLENLLATRYWTAVKTGTSKDMRDNWCVGYSDRYTVGVWVGNFSGVPMWDVSGVTGAAPVWNEVMNYLHRSATSGAPAPPPGIVARTVAFAGSNRPPQREWFLAGTEQEVVRSSRTQQQPKILYPAPDTVIALDPDIPAELQKVFFAFSPAATLLLDGASIAPARWTPVPGSHRLTLIGKDGTVADQLDFEVR